MGAALSKPCDKALDLLHSRVMGDAHGVGLLRLWWLVVAVASCTRVPQRPAPGAACVVARTAAGPAAAPPCAAATATAAKAAPSATSDLAGGSAESSSLDVVRTAVVGYDAKRARAMLSADAGVVVARSLGCEGPVTSEVKHLCGAPASAALEHVRPGLRDMLDAALRFPDEPGIHCTGSTPVVCTVAPHGECQPLYQLYFSDATLLAIVERDDWQGNDEDRRAFDARVQAALEGVTCP